MASDITPLRPRSAPYVVHAAWGQEIRASEWCSTWRHVEEAVGFYRRHYPASTVLVFRDGAPVDVAAREVAL